MALVAGIGLGTFIIIFIILVGLAVIFLGEQTEHPMYGWQQLLQPSVSHSPHHHHRLVF